MSDRLTPYRSALGVLDFVKVTIRKDGAFVRVPASDVTVHIAMCNDDGREDVVINFFRGKRKKAITQIWLSPELSHTFQEAIFGPLEGVSDSATSHPKGVQ